MMTIEEREAVEGEAVVEVVHLVVVELVLNVMKKAIWLENVLMQKACLEMLVEVEEVVVLVLATNVMKKAIWQENVLILVQMVMIEDEEEEVEEEASVVETEHVTNVTKRAIWLENVLMMEMIEVRDLIKDREEKMVVQLGEIMMIMVAQMIGIIRELVSNKVHGMITKVKMVGAVQLLLLKVAMRMLKIILHGLNRIVLLQMKQDGQVKLVVLLSQNHQRKEVLVGIRVMKLIGDSDISLC